MAACLVLISLNYTSPLSVKTFTAKALKTGTASCSTVVTMPTVGASLAKPDSIMFENILHAKTGSAAPSCSVFIRGTFGTTYGVEWPAWQWAFNVDSGISFTEIGRPWGAYDYLYLKVKMYAGDSCTITQMPKYLGGITLSVISNTPAWTSRNVNPTTPCTLNVSTDCFIINNTTHGRLVLPLASSCTRILRVVAGVAPAISPDSIFAQGTDAFLAFPVSSPTCPILTKAGDNFTLISDGVSRWSFK